MATDQRRNVLAQVVDELIATARELRHEAQCAKARAAQVRTQARAFTAGRRAERPQPAVSPEDDPVATRTAAAQGGKTTASGG